MATKKKNDSKKNENKNKNKKPKTLFRKVIRAQLLIFAVAFLAIVGLFCVKFLPDVIRMKNDAKTKVENSDHNTFKANETSLVYDTKGDLIKTIKGEKEVYYLDYSNIPQTAIDAMISIEDKKFYQHKGIDLMANVRAVIGVVLHKGDRSGGGGSTITQQLSRNVFLTTKYSWQRKVEEIFVSLNVEKKYSKDEIMEFYLNNIYFANGYYGIQAAANGYFNKSVNSLSLSQIALLCAVPNSPTAYNPRENLDRALLRRDKILKNMYEDGKISEPEYNEALNEKIKIKKKKVTDKNNIETFIYDSATKALMKSKGFTFRYSFKDDADKETYNADYDEMYSSCQKSLYTEGYRIYTSIDLEKQAELQKSVDDALVDFTEKSDEGIYKVQGAAVSIDNSNGKVVAIVGGRDQDISDGYSLNRAFQSFRQPGSTIKPLLVYTPAFEKLGYTPDTIVEDVKFKPEENGPKNATDSYLGRIPLRLAVEKSKNVVAWRIYQELTPKVGMNYLKEMGFAKLAPDDFVNIAPSLGGFTHGVSVLEMASGYAALENDGVYREPTCIIKILSSDGQSLVSDAEQVKVIYSGNASRMMTDILKGVLKQGGTGGGIGSITNMETAGKTGTTNDYKDGWFCGYTPYYTTTVWVGCDIPETISGLQGASYPGRIWKQYMAAVHDGLEPRSFPEYVSKGETNNNQPSTEATTTEVTTQEVTTEAATEVTEAPTEEVTTQAPTTEAPPEEVTTAAPPTEEVPPATEAPDVPDEDPGVEGEGDIEEDIS